MNSQQKQTKASQSILIPPVFDSESSSAKLSSTNEQSPIQSIHVKTPEQHSKLSNTSRSKHLNLPVSPSLAQTSSTNESPIQSIHIKTPEYNAKLSNTSNSKHSNTSYNVDNNKNYNSGW